MAKRIAINGFGRIGRLTLRNLLDQPGIEVVAVNDLTSNDMLAHLFKYDSTQGNFKGAVKHNSKSITIKGKRIRAFSERDPKKLPWKELGIDIVLECTGFFRELEKASWHIEAGAKKVIISAPAKTEGVPTIVMGVNEKSLSKKAKVISNASCTTNCLAPLVKIIQANWGMKQGFMTTIHAYTGDQRLLDAPHRDMRRARSAALNVVPTSTGAAKALALVIPESKGLITASAVRVPVPTGSLVELTFVMKKKGSAEDINAVFKKAAKSSLKGILEYCDDPIVSSDIVGNPHSSIFDSLLTTVSGNMAKIVSWYDNEAGYSARLADMAIKL